MRRWRRAVSSARGGVIQGAGDGFVLLEAPCRRARRAGEDRESEPPQARLVALSRGHPAASAKPCCCCVRKWPKIRFDFIVISSSSYDSGNPVSSL